MRRTTRCRGRGRVCADRTTEGRVGTRRVWERLLRLQLRLRLLSLLVHLRVWLLLLR